MKAVEICGLSKTYGKRAALDGITFDVEAGDAVALIGRNGAGKTTLLRILATLLKPTAGYAKILGLDGRFQAPKIRRSISFMPDASAMDEDLTVGEYLDFFAALHNLAADRRMVVVRDLIALLDLGEVRDQSCGSLSRGMQQRVALARSLVHDPSILLLDEPAANLDPRARIEIREVLKELRKMGKTILISSHILMELGELCNKIALLDHGKLVRFGSLSDLAGTLRPFKRIAMKVAGDPERLAAALRSEPTVKEVTFQKGELVIVLNEGVDDHAFVARRAVQEQASILSLREEEADLEEIFMRLTSPQGGG